MKAKLALEELEASQVLRIIVDYEPAVSEVPKAMEFDGHVDYPLLRSLKNY